MLPEIALTAQIILRLQKHFGPVTGVYHSRFNDQEKAEIWKRVADEDPLTDTGSYSESGPLYFFLSVISD